MGNGCEGKGVAATFAWILDSCCRYGNKRNMQNAFARKSNIRSAASLVGVGVRRRGTVGQGLTLCGMLPHIKKLSSAAWARSESIYL